MSSLVGLLVLVLHCCNITTGHSLDSSSLLFKVKS